MTAAPRTPAPHTSTPRTPAPWPSDACAAKTYPDRTHRTCAEWDQAGDTKLPDLGSRLARFIVLRACGRRIEQLAAEFNLSWNQVRALLARHGEPPCFAGSAAARMTSHAAFSHAGHTHPKD